MWLRGAYGASLDTLKPTESATARPLVVLENYMSVKIKGNPARENAGLRRV
jgi:hypothetical protein